MKRNSNRFWARVVPWVVLAHCFLFIIFWITNRLFYDSVNTFIIEKTGFVLDYVSFCLIFSAIIGFAAILMLWLGRNGPKQGWVVLFSIFGIFFILFFYGSFFVLFSQDPTQPVRLWRLVRYFGLYVNSLLLAIFVALISIYVVPSLIKKAQGSKRDKTPFMIGTLVLFLLIWAPAFWILPGNVVTQGAPDKPWIIGHRGAAALAPENTIAAAELAFQLGAAGVETDIRISQDGVPFLMHDSNLLRTTDVSTIFPGREHEDASSFTWAELHRLNAGKWFAEMDPFGTIQGGDVSLKDLNIYSQVGIPSLQDELATVKKDGLIFIFDLLPPPESHPFHDSFFETCLTEIQKAGIGNKVWFLIDPDQLGSVRQKIPDMIPAYGADFQNPPAVNLLQEDGYQIVNVGFGLSDKWIQNYRSSGVKVNLYVVDERWMFSDLWLKGVSSMTTNNVEAMTMLVKPVGSISLTVYRILWAVIGLAGCIALVLVFNPRK
jgi:glycerophosphoinositol inositolphosphodiesterase